MYIYIIHIYIYILYVIYIGIYWHFTFHTSQLVFCCEVRTRCGCQVISWPVSQETRETCPSKNAMGSDMFWLVLYLETFFAVRKLASGLRHAACPLSLLAQGWTAAQASNSKAETPWPRWSWQSCFASPSILVPLPLQMRLSAWSVIWRCCSWTPRSQTHIHRMEWERRGRRSHWRTAGTWHKRLALKEQMLFAATTAPSTHMAKTAIDRFPRPPEHGRCWIIIDGQDLCIYIYYVWSKWNVYTMISMIH